MKGVLFWTISKSQRWKIKLNSNIERIPIQIQSQCGSLKPQLTMWLWVNRSMTRQCHHCAPTVEGSLTTMTAMSLGDTNLWDNLMCSPVLTKTCGTGQNLTFPIINVLAYKIKMTEQRGTCLLSQYVRRIRRSWSAFATKTVWGQSGL